MSEQSDWIRNGRRRAMRRVLVKVVFVAITSVLVASTAIAQDTGGGNPQPAASASPDVFAWLPDWRLGLLLGVAGLAGALATIFFLVGGVVPWTAGRARLDAAEARLETMSQRLDTLMNAAKVDPAAVTAVENAVNNLRNNITKVRRQDFVIATCLYAILGTFFALLLAKDPIQALLFGAGWTGLTGALGIQRDFEERKEIKNRVLGQLQALNQETGRINANISASNAPAQVAAGQLPTVSDAEIQVARRL